MIEFDDEPTLDNSMKWWELLENTETFIRFHYDEIMSQGSDELKRAAEIVLGGHPPGVYKHNETA